VKASEFYTGVLGFEEVYRQPDANMSSFISNGNTYHDFGLTDIHSRYAAKDQRPGLYHIAFEHQTEAELVKGYDRAIAAGVKFRAARDQDVARSVYTYDPDHTHVEYYADTVADWRSVRHGIIVKKKPEWIPGVTSVPITEARHPTGDDLRYVKDAVLHGKKVTHVSLVAADYEAMYDYYTTVAGLNIFAGSRSGSYTVLRGSAGEGDITLYRPGAGLTPGLRHVGVQMWGEDDLDHALAEIPSRGLKILGSIEHAARRAVVIEDPDGSPLQLYVNRQWTPAVVGTVSAADALYLL
jgi:catechol 2,3-dioxygenase